MKLNFVLVDFSPCSTRRHRLPHPFVEAVPPFAFYFVYNSLYTFTVVLLNLRVYNSGLVARTHSDLLNLIVVEPDSVQIRNSPPLAYFGILLRPYFKRLLI